MFKMLPKEEVRKLTGGLLDMFRVLVDHTEGERVECLRIALNVMFSGTYAPVAPFHQLTVDGGRLIATVGYGLRLEEADQWAASLADWLDPRIDIRLDTRLAEAVAPRA